MEFVVESARWDEISDTLAEEEGSWKELVAEACTTHCDQAVKDLHNKRVVVIEPYQRVMRFCEEHKLDPQTTPIQAIVSASVTSASAGESFELARFRSEANAFLKQVRCGSIYRDALLANDAENPGTIDSAIGTITFNDAHTWLIERDLSLRSLILNSPHLRPNISRFTVMDMGVHQDEAMFSREMRQAKAARDARYQQCVLHVGRVFGDALSWIKDLSKASQVAAQGQPLQAYLKELEVMDTQLKEDDAVYRRPMAWSGRFVEAAQSQLADWQPSVRSMAKLLQLRRHIKDQLEENRVNLERHEADVNQMDRQSNQDEYRKRFIDYSIQNYRKNWTLKLKENCSTLMGVIQTEIHPDRFAVLGTPPFVIHKAQTNINQVVGYLSQQLQSLAENHEQCLALARDQEGLPALSDSYYEKRLLVDLLRFYEEFLRHFDALMQNEQISNNNSNWKEVAEEFILEQLRAITPEIPIPTCEQMHQRETQLGEECARLARPVGSQLRSVLQKLANAASQVETQLQTLVEGSIMRKPPPVPDWIARNRPVSIPEKTQFEITEKLYHWVLKSQQHWASASVGNSQVCKDALGSLYRASRQRKAGKAFSVSDVWKEVWHWARAIAFILAYTRNSTTSQFMDTM